MSNTFQDFSLTAVRERATEFLTLLSDGKSSPFNMATVSNYHLAGTLPGSRHLPLAITLQAKS